MGSATSRKFLLLGPLLLFLGLAYVVPFLGVVRWSFTLPETGFGQYIAVFTDPLVQSVFVRTLRICLIVTAASLITAYAIAYVWVRGSSIQRALAEFCILVPFWISVLTRAFGWLAMLSNRGLINTWLQSAGIISEPLALARNEFGVIVGMTHFLIPFAVFPIASAMRSIDERVLLAARGMGSSRSRTFWTSFPAFDLWRIDRCRAHRLRVCTWVFRHTGDPRRRSKRYGGGAGLSSGSSRALTGDLAPQSAWYWCCLSRFCWHCCGALSNPRIWWGQKSRM